MNTYKAYIAIFFAGLLLFLPSCILSSRIAKTENQPEKSEQISSSPAENGKVKDIRDVETDALAEGCTLDDVIGTHNPRMISIWMGNLTKEEGFLRNQTSGRSVTELRHSLMYYRIIHGTLPATWDDFERSCLFPFIPLDIITTRPYRYLAPGEPKQDINDVTVSTSTDDWIITGQYQKLDGSIEEFTERDADSMRYEWWEKETKAKYQSVVALRGHLLALDLSYMVEYYQQRRNDMPNSADELFDGLWAVGQPWASFDGSIDCLAPSSFVFGLDRESEYAIAKWRDEKGALYIKTYDYSPWPQGGWDHVPTYSEYCQRQVQNGYGIDTDEAPNSFPNDFEPPLILWKCSLEPR